MPLATGKSSQVISKNISELAYLAGIIDGEGCFNIAECRTSYIPRILVTNTNKDLILWLKDNFGGDISKTVVKNRNNWKPRYMWRLSSQKALDLAELIHDYLVIKWGQALVFVTWSACRNVFKPNDRKEGYDYLKDYLKKLNQKGMQYAL